MHHEIPPFIVSGLFSLGAAGVTGIFTWLGGEHTGKGKGRIEGEAKFINAVKDAAAIVIEGLKEQHEECRSELASVKAQIAELMAASVPGYEINPGRQDG